MKPATAPFELNGLRVDPGAGTIHTGDGVQRLPMRLMKLLCLLVEAGPDTVDRDVLVGELWPRGFVNEEALSRSVAELRRHLGDDARNPEFIETIPKRGYRLVATIRPSEGDRPVLKRHSANVRTWGLAAAGILVAGWIAYQGLAPKKAPVNTALLATATRLTADPVMKYHPQLSPDGSWLAYIRREEDRMALFLLPTANPTQTRKLESPHSVWSPVFGRDSSRLAVAMVIGTDCVVHLWAVNGDPPEPLGPCVIPNESPVLDWSNDGALLAYVDIDPRTGSAAIWQMTLADGKRVKLTSPPDAYSYDTRPRFSPDGKRLSFTRGTRAAREIWVLDLDQAAGDGSPFFEPRQLSFDHQYMISHEWMADNRTLLLDSERTGYRALWSLDLEGEWSLLGARDAESPSLAGNRLAFKISQYESNIWPLNVSTGEPAEHPLISSNKYDSNPAWSPDGQEIAFSSNRTGRGSIWISSADGKRERLVYEPDEGRVMAPAWSPDGAFLIATQYRTGGQNLVRIALNRREVTVIATSGTRPYAGAFSADGAWLYYIAGAGIEGNRLWRQAADGNNDGEILIDQPVNSYRVEPGYGVFYTKHEQDGLFRATFENLSTESALIPGLRSYVWDNWTTANGWIYYPAVTADDSAKLFRLPLDGGEAEIVSDFYPNSLGPSLAMQPNSDIMLVARTDRAQSDLFLVEL